MERAVAFGHWLKQRRTALDITQEELAARVGCAVETIRKIEANQRRPSRDIAERIAREVAAAPAERAAVVRAARSLGSADLPPPAPRASHPHALPVPATALLGRERQLQEIAARLQQPGVRLLTLTGPGGIGKSRLVIQVATEAQGAFADGVKFVALAPLRDAALVIPAIAQVLGVRERPDQALELTVQTALRDQHLLLVLDNFEHLLAAAVVVADLLLVAPALSVLATSRAPLHLAGEQQFAVPPLTLPDTQPADMVTQVARSEAGALFIARAHAVQRDFAVTNVNAPAIAAICHRLDGLPLAIELAAARITVLSPPDLLRRLEQSLALLTGGSRDLPARQQTMRATIDWSYALLTAPEQALFQRLGVFEGGFTLAAAEVVCSNGVGEMVPIGDLPAVDGLQRLVDTSLVQHRTDVDGEVRFSMLETIREYARECLAASGELAKLQRQHATYFTTLAETTPTEDQAREWWDRLEQEHANLRAALAWSQSEAGGETGLRLTVALFSFWRARGHLREAHRWTVAAVTPPGAERAAAPATERSRRLRANALNTLGVFTTFIGDLDGAQRWFDEGLALFRELGDEAGIADVLANRGMLFQMQADFTRAGADLDESLRRYRTLGRASEAALGVYFLGTLAYSEGDVLRAGALWEESLTVFRAEDASWSIGLVLVHLAMVALDQGDDERAGTYLAESITRFQAQDERWQSIVALEVCARWVAQRGRRVADAHAENLRAARWFGAAEALRETLGAPRLEIYGEHHRRAVAGLRSHLDETACAAVWAEGRALTLEQAVTEALAALGEGAATDAPVGANRNTRRAASMRPLTRLTPREVDVLRAVAEGATDQTVAERLGLRPRTVTSYLTSIYTKLDVRTRTAALYVARERRIIE